MPDSFKPSLLESLRERAQALRAQREAARKPMADAIKDIDDSLWRVFRWLDEANSHLEVIRPRVEHVFQLHHLLRIGRPKFDRGFVAFRRRTVEEMDVLGYVEYFYRLQGDAPIALRLPSVASRTAQEQLRASTLPYEYRSEQDEDGIVRYSLFQVQPLISASVRFEPDYDTHCVQVTLRNVDRFESVLLDFAPDKVNEAALEDLVKFMMGEPNAFLRRAPLTLIRGQTDDEAAAAK